MVRVSSQSAERVTVTMRRVGAILRLCLDNFVDGFELLLMVKIVL